MPLRHTRRTCSAARVAAALAALAAWAVHPTSCVAAPAPGAHPGGALFSTIDCAATPLGEEWSRLRAEVATRFPDLRLTRVEDLHVTIVYVGEGWRTEDLERIRAHVLVAPQEQTAFRPEIVRMGRNNNVVAVELHDAPAQWREAVVAAKAEMNRLGLKRPEPYDAAFRPHVTLASTQGTPPSAPEATALEELRSWLAEKLAASPSRFTVTLGPKTSIRLWLAGLARPADSSAYVDLEELLARR